MEMVQHADPGVRALAEGRAFVDLSSHRKVRVSGTDAPTWLHDLLTASVADLEPGAATRSLLLTPTGRIRADLHVARDDEGFLLLQPADQPDHIGLLLAPYVLSAAVQLEDATPSLALFAILGDGASRVGHPGTSPSILGPGLDVVVAAGAAWRFEEGLLRADLVEASPDEIERWRIASGVARMGPDFSQESLPAEVGLESTIDRTKGCFLGQESVAMVHNLGHPPWLVVACSFLGDAEAGDAVLVSSGEVGYLTSVAAGPDRTAAIARVRWEARDQNLTLPDGRRIHVGWSG